MQDRNSRRAFLQTLATGAAALALPELSFGQKTELNKKTFTYKTVEQCQIKADVYGISAETARPVIIWIHGGAWMGTGVACGRVA